MHHLDRYRGRTILVTGGAGAIGSNLVRSLTMLSPAEVIVLDDLSSGLRWNVPHDSSVTFVHGSVTDDAALESVFAACPHIVFHLAALFANQNSVDHPELDLRTNGLGTLRVLERARRAAVGRVVYASSGRAIYGSDSPLPLREQSMSLKLSTPYQITKMLGELYCNYYTAHADMEIVRLRFFNSYGPGEFPGRYRNVIPNFVFWAKLGEPLRITGTGDETRDFTFVEDLVDGILRAGVAPNGPGRAFNLGSGHETRVRDLALHINRLTGNDAGVRHMPRRPWDANARVCASIDLASSLLGYRPRTGLLEGLERTVAWFDENWAIIRDTAGAPAPAAVAT
jgi:nucleoside-diphosphate-sugar epimerase